MPINIVEASPIINRQTRDRAGLGVENRAFKRCKEAPTIDPHSRMAQAIPPIRVRNIRFAGD